jgi:DNA-directed RNA polymerase specialized sigma subunit
MEDKDYKEERFDSYLNKTIILSSKQYYRNEIAKDLKELKIIDDENYEEYMKDYLKYDEDVCNCSNVENFIEMCENPMLICALKSLSEIEMMVIFLLFEKQLTSSESSKILEICSDSVTRIKRRALKKIEKYLKGDEEL